MTAALEQRWVAFVRGADTVGTLAALTSVFASRGVSFDSLSTGGVHDDTGLVVITFTSSERRRRLLVRTVARLSAVRNVTVLPVTDPQVRAAGVVHLPDGAPFAPPEGSGVRWSAGEPGPAGRTVLVEGRLAEVEVVVEHARAVVGAVVATVVLPPRSDVPARADAPSGPRAPNSPTGSR